jgi:hypothetical protein
MYNPTYYRARGFTALESIAMLLLLATLSMVTLAVSKKGLTTAATPQSDSPMTPSTPGQSSQLKVDPKTPESTVSSDSEADSRTIPLAPDGTGTSK